MGVHWEEAWSYGELWIAHREGAEVFQRTLALVWWEETVGGVFDSGAHVGGDMLGGAHND